eukprot:gene26981-biopygen17553
MVYGLNEDDHKSLDKNKYADFQAAPRPTEALKAHDEAASDDFWNDA